MSCLSWEALKLCVDFHDLILRLPAVPYLVQLLLPRGDTELSVRHLYL